jgi:Alpha/beta hydrolase domain
MVRRLTALGALVLLVLLPAGRIAAAPAAVEPATGPSRPLASTELDLASVGYERSELVLTGTASTFRPASPLTPDGRWSVAPDGHAPFRTRLVVYRPVDPRRFRGTAMVEWLNVSGGIDAAANWNMAHVQEIREGMVWVGVSAQPGVGADRDGLALPGNAYSYDVYSQAGRAVRDDPGVLGGLHARRVIAVGESQSAFFLTSYIDGLATTTHVYDGYLVHSRASFAAPFDDSPALRPGAPVQIRTDVGVPVLVFATETDLALLGSLATQQPDTRAVRTWEVAGTAHYDAYGLGIGARDAGDGPADRVLFDAMGAADASTPAGSGPCARPLNAGPATYVMRAAVHQLDRWVRTGVAPPPAPRIQADPSGEGPFALDAHGNARGGIRTPQVDAAIATLSGAGQSGSGFCFLFGTTTAFGADELASLYPSHARFVRAWKAATLRAVGVRFVPPADSEERDDAAAQSTVGS